MNRRCYETPDGQLVCIQGDGEPPPGATPITDEALADEFAARRAQAST